MVFSSIRLQASFGKIWIWFRFAVVHPARGIYLHLVGYFHGLVFKVCRGSFQTAKLGVVAALQAEITPCSHRVCF